MISKRGTLQRRLTLITMFLRWEWLLVMLLVIAFIVNILLSPHFLDTRNLFDMTFNFMERSIIALPMAFIIISGNIDLSVASTLAMSAVLMATRFQAGWNIWLAVLFGLAVGALGGLLNGTIIAKMRLPSLVVTLGTYALYRGIAFVALGDRAVTGFPSQFLYLGQGYVDNTPVPVPLVIFAVLALLFGLLLHRTSFGRFVYAIGNNEEACHYSGVAVDRIKIALFTLSGLMSALAAVILTARFNCGKIQLTGLGLPSEMAEYIKSGCCKEMALWNPIDLGYLTIYVSHYMCTGEITGKVGDTFTGGKLGQRTVVSQDGGTMVLLGPPFKFNAQNIDEWKGVY